VRTRPAVVHHDAVTRHRVYTHARIHTHHRVYTRATACIHTRRVRSTQPGQGACAAASAPCLARACLVRAWSGRMHRSKRPSPSDAPLLPRSTSTSSTAARTARAVTYQRALLHPYICCISTVARTAILVYRSRLGKGGPGGWGRGAPRGPRTHTPAATAPPASHSPAQPPPSPPPVTHRSHPAPHSGGAAQPHMRPLTWPQKNPCSSRILQGILAAAATGSKQQRRSRLFASPPPLPFSTVSPPSRLAAAPPGTRGPPCRRTCRHGTEPAALRGRERGQTRGRKRPLPAGAARDPAQGRPGQVSRA
jgi:hypothetical protein